jgi:hypothetical protein
MELNFRSDITSSITVCECLVGRSCRVDAQNHFLFMRSRTSSPSTSLRMKTAFACVAFASLGVAETLPPPPNVDYFQKTVSIYEMNTDQGSSEMGFKKNVFRLKYENNNTAYGYSIPDALSSTWLPMSETHNQTIATYSSSAADYQFNLAYETTFDAGLSIQGKEINWLTVSVSVSEDFRYSGEIFASHVATLVTSRAKTKTWSASLSEVMGPNDLNMILLDTEFEYYVSKLPAVYDPQIYHQFIQEYGTHYIRSLVMGAKYSCRTFFENATLATM